MFLEEDTNTHENGGTVGVKTYMRRHETKTVKAIVVKRNNSSVIRVYCNIPMQIFEANILRHDYFFIICCCYEKRKKNVKIAFFRMLMSKHSND